MPPRISIIIPTLNEAENVPRLLRSLACQKNIIIETIIADGGSSDGTAAAAKKTAKETGLNFKSIASAAGRGRQMNCGAKIAEARDLLFLHADSIVKNPHFLAAAGKHMDELRAARGAEEICGHYPLSFFSESQRKTDAFYFHETKTHINRPWCVNGDQGFWLSADFFSNLGGFDESLPFLEDLRLSAKIFERGEWTTLPGRIFTSSRRFEREGFWQRHAMNALVCALEDIGLSEFFTTTSEAYVAQNQSSQLNLKEILRKTHRLVFKDGLGRAFILWYKAGRHVSKNAWQAALALDCLANRRKGLPPGEGPTPVLEFFDKRLVAAAEALPGTAAAAFFSFLWFYGIMAFSRKPEKRK